MHGLETTWYACNLGLADAGIVEDHAFLKDSLCGTVAHVWDAEAKKWWRCDDETVTEMPKGPVAERADHGVAAEKKVSPVSCMMLINLGHYSHRCI